MSTCLILISVLAMILLGKLRGFDYKVLYFFHHICLPLNRGVIIIAMSS